MGIVRAWGKLIIRGSLQGEGVNPNWESLQFRKVPSYEKFTVRSLFKWERVRGPLGKSSDGGIIFFFYVFGIFHNFLLCRPSQRSALSQVPSQVATLQKIGSLLWAGEVPDWNPGLQDYSLMCYHWATTPSQRATTPSQRATTPSQRATTPSQLGIGMEETNVGIGIPSSIISVWYWLNGLNVYLMLWTFFGNSKCK